MLFSELAKRVAEKYPEVKTVYPMDCELSNVELYDPSGAAPPVDTLGIYTARQIGQDMTLPLCFVCAGAPDHPARCWPIPSRSWSITRTGSTASRSAIWITT